MSDLEPNTVTWIATQLVKVDFVKWDRYTVGERGDRTIVDVYGWIDRDDDYKDFVWTRFWPANEVFEYTTSSDTYSEQLAEIWFGESSDHDPCNRVENTFDIPNAVTLE